jgi:hypothetical protein
LFKIIHSTGAKGSTQTNQKNKLGLKRKEQKRKPKAALVWRTGPSGAPPDSVRCTRVNQLELFTFRFLRRSSAIIHRTVWCTSGAMTICTQQSTLQSEQWNSDVRATSQRGTGLPGATPDSPVPHEDKASNGQPTSGPNKKMTWRRTRHCPVAHWTLSGAPITSRLHQRLDFGWWL